MMTLALRQGICTLLRIVVRKSNLVKEQGTKEPKNLGDTLMPFVRFIEKVAELQPRGTVPWLINQVILTLGI